MIVYTAMPLERVFDGMDENRRLKEIQVEGMTMLVEPISPDQGKIVRLISSNPNDYLNMRYEPGQKIYFRPEIQK